MKRQAALLLANAPAEKKLKRSTSVIFPPRGLSAVQKRQVSRIIDSKEETKYFDVFYNSVEINTTGVTAALSVIPQGVGVSQRIGNQIRIKAVKIIWELTAGASFNALRAIFWTYKSQTALTPPISTVILQNGSGGAAPQTDSQYNWQNKKEYKVHLDKKWDLSLNTSAAYLQSFTHRMNIPEKFQLVDFNDNTATTGVGHLCLTVLSTSTAAVGSQPKLKGTLRIFYQDA